MRKKQSNRDFASLIVGVLRDYRKFVSVATINNYIRNLRVFFNWLERDYYNDTKNARNVLISPIYAGFKMYTIEKIHQCTYQPNHGRHMWLVGMFCSSRIHENPIFYHAMTGRPWTLPL